MNQGTLIIVGAGFSGVALACAISRKNRFNKILLIEKENKNFFRGKAYLHLSPHYLLNVRARDMGFSANAVDDFHLWLEKNYPGVFGPDDFVARGLYGDYLEDQIAPVLAAQFVTKIVDEIVDIRGKEAVGKNGNYEFDKMVLALGGNYELPRIPDDVLAMPVVKILGSGLSAVDIVVDLAHKNYSGKFELYSRHGLLPMVHDESRGDFETKDRLIDLFSKIKAYGNKVGGNQFIVRQLRPRLAEIWNQFTILEKRQFNRYLRSYWEVFRHRMPLGHFNIIEEMKRAGRLSVHKLKGQIEGDFINCTGFRPDDRNGLLERLNCNGMIKADPLGWGHTSNRADIHFLGPYQRFEKFEISAVNEIRREVDNLVAAL